MGQPWTSERRASEAHRKAYWKGMAEMVAGVRGDKLPLNQCTAKPYIEDIMAVLLEADAVKCDEIQVMYGSGEIDTAYMETLTDPGGRLNDATGAFIRQWCSVRPNPAVTPQSNEAADIATRIERLKEATARIDRLLDDLLDDLGEHLIHP